MPVYASVNSIALNKKGSSGNHSQLPMPADMPDVTTIRKIEELMRTDPKMSVIIRDITSNITASS